MTWAGNLPRVVGNFRGECPEFMMVQYMPVIMPDGGLALPHRMEWLRPMIRLALQDIDLFQFYRDFGYMYATVKHGHVDSGNHQNRPGWHIDGYGSDDLNYIWYDKSPTEFLDQEMELPDDHELSMQHMEHWADDQNVVSYHSKLVLKLDNTVIHRVRRMPVSGVRTFVKLSVSRHKYNLKGNAHNHLFKYDWVMHPRLSTRNHPFVEEE